MLSQLAALFLVFTSFITSDHCVEAIRYDLAKEATREESQRFQDRYFRHIPIYPVLRFSVIDNAPNDRRFKNEIGCNRALGVFEKAAYFVQSMFGPDGFGRGYAYVQLLIINFRGSEMATSIATTNSTKIRVNSVYIENLVGDAKYEFDGVIFHECANMWLQSRHSLVPSGILTRIADFVRLQGGWPSRSWPKRGSGTRWTDGYVIIVYFLKYCSHYKNDFVAELNSMMNKGYRDGKDIRELWDDYKPLYAAKTMVPAPAPRLRQGY